MNHQTRVCNSVFVPDGRLLAGPSSGPIYEGPGNAILRDKAGFGVMIFPDGLRLLGLNNARITTELD